MTRDREPMPVAAREALLAWYARARRNLPFRATTDPYAVLVSEAMAQQTQAARAAEAWTRFMSTFPTVDVLAAASPADVLRAWRGLGYNRRALNLRAAARVIVDVHGGVVPSDLAALEALPGVGPYTARAVAAIAFGVPVGAVDTNVRRVLGRMVAGDASSLGHAELQAVADAVVPIDRSAAWTHGLMDLGATVCLPRRPACDRCPVQTWCRYVARGQSGATTTARPPASNPPDAVELHHRRRPVPLAARRPTRTPTPFPRTTRWLRGRLIDRLRAADGDGWVVIDAPIGTHDPVAVAAALDALAREGLIELDGTTATGGRRARLPVG